MAKNCGLMAFRFGNIGNTDWEARYLLLCRALQEQGYTLWQDKQLKLRIDGAAPLKDGNVSLDLAVYNHSTNSEVVGQRATAKRVWFMHPAVPDKTCFTVDDLGFGPYTGLTQTAPDLTDIAPYDVTSFFASHVRDWIAARASKWGSFSGVDRIPEKDYYLVLGQTLRDATVTQMWWGNYADSVCALVVALLRADDRDIVVKLHPFMDQVNNGQVDTTTPGPIESEFVRQLRKATKNNERVRVYRGNLSVHDFIARCRCALVCNSSSGYEVMMHHKPIIAYGYPEYHHVAYDLRHLCDLQRALMLDWFDVNKSDSFLYWYMMRHVCRDYASTLRRVKELDARAGISLTRPAVQLHNPDFIKAASVTVHMSDAPGLFNPANKLDYSPDGWGYASTVLPAITYGQVNTTLKYDIIMPYYNRGEQLRVTLNTFKLQYKGRADYRVIILEDHKTADSTEDHAELSRILQDYSQTIPSLLLQPHFPGVYNPCLAYNCGVKSSNAPYIILTNPECAHSSDVLGGLDRVRNLSEVYTVCACLGVDNFTKKFSSMTEFTWRKLNWKHHSTQRMNFQHFCSCISRELYWRVGGFDEEYQYGFGTEDMDFIYQIIRAGIPILARDDLLTLHLAHRATLPYDSNIRKRMQAWSTKRLRDKGYIGLPEHIGTNLTE